MQFYHKWLDNTTIVLTLHFCRKILAKYCLKKFGSSQNNNDAFRNGAQYGRWRELRAAHVRASVLRDWSADKNRSIEFNSPAHACACKMVTLGLCTWPILSGQPWAQPMNKVIYAYSGLYWGLHFCHSLADCCRLNYKFLTTSSFFISSICNPLTHIRSVLTWTGNKSFFGKVSVFGFHILRFSKCGHTSCKVTMLSTCGSGILIPSARQHDNEGLRAVKGWRIRFLHHTWVKKGKW